LFVPKAESPFLILTSAKITKGKIATKFLGLQIRKKTTFRILGNFPKVVVKKNCFGVYV